MRIKYFFLIFSIIFFFFPIQNVFAHSQSQDRLFIIDDDIGMNKDAVAKTGSYWIPWLKVTDPDGGLELIYTLGQPNVTILGVTTVMGVVTTDVAFSAGENILKVLDKTDVPVFKGAQTPGDLGKETPAARFIVDMVRKYPGRVEIIATGPLTNIATAIMMEPELPKLWHTLHFATGEFLGGLAEKSDFYKFITFGLSDLNINVDPAATEYVLTHGGSFPVYPNELMDDILFKRSDHEKIADAAQTKSKLARFLAYELGPLNFLARFFRIPLHGVIPTGVILDPELECKTVEKAVVMKKYGYRGYAFALSDDPSLPKHKICFRLDNAAKNTIHERLIQRITE